MNGKTALILAAGKGHVNIVELLLAAEANVNLKDDNGDTALILAAIKGHEEIVKQLIAVKASLNLKVVTAIQMMAAQKNHGK